ncbi:MAG: methyl-accepting chemotaxis protein [Leptolyngbyaceae cyanobacterium MO_188.B28]|nr:methyl-accepting chemotaxis protein [Leptolyngbyaceae cyanobacterium MO_188.B28]
MTTPNNTPTQADFHQPVNPKSAISIDDFPKDGSKRQKAPHKPPKSLSPGPNIQNQDNSDSRLDLATRCLQFSKERWLQLTIKTKAIILGVALGTVPVLLVGGVGTYLASQDLTKETLEDRQRMAAAISLQMKEFVQDRLYDMEEIANAPVVVDAIVRESAIPRDVLNYLDSYLERDPTYSTIAAIRPDGGYAYLDNENTIPFMVRKGKIPPEAYQPDKKPFVEKQIPYFLQVRDTRHPAVSPLRISPVTGKSFFYIAAPAFKASASELAYVIFSQISADDLSDLMTEHVSGLLQGVGADKEDILAQFSVIDHGAAYFERTDTGLVQEIPSNRLEVQGNSVKIDGQPFQPGDSTFIQTNRIFVSNEPGRTGVEIGTVFPAYAKLKAAGAAASTLDVSKEDGQKYLLTYIPVPQVEQLAINWGVLLYEPAAEVFAPQRMLVLFLLSGAVVAAIFAASLGAYFSSRAIQPIMAVADTVTQLGQGNLEARVVVTGKDELASLGGHINQMAVQIQTLLTAKAETAMKLGPIQAVIEEQQQQWNQALKADLSQLLTDLEGLSGGDLTLQTQQTTGEIGIVGERFNVIVASLRAIAVQVKRVVAQVNQSIGRNEEAVRQLADEALVQVDEMTYIMASVEQMSTSIQTVAESARQASDAAHNAAISAQTGDAAMDRTVESMVNLRSTVADTTKKVKQLGEAAQEISQVSSLINGIAMKTNLLAVNASIGATHAGEEGEGFDVVAGDVGELAEQVSAATQKIEQIVQKIQSSTREVVYAMEQDTTQVVDGAHRVQEVKQNLQQILAVSTTVDQLLKSISEATVSHADTSQALTQRVKQMTQASSHNLDSSRLAAGAIRETVEIAQTLETTVDQFKIETESF